MATVSAPNRTIIGWLFIVGGALQIIAALVALANVGNSSALYAISNIAIGIGFGLMTTWLARTNMARIAYLIATIGWLLLALTSLINFGPLFTIAVFIAIVGSIFAGVVVMMTHPFGGNADVVFLCAMIVGAFNLALTQAGGIPSLLSLPFIVGFGALLVFAGSLMFARRASAGRA